MTRSAIVPSRLLPEAVRRLAPRKRSAQVLVFSGGDLPLLSWGTWWDGGSQNRYAWVNLKTGAAHHPPVPTSPFGSPGPGQADVTPPAGCVLVQYGTSCGRPAQATVSVRPDDLPALAGDLDCDVAWPVCIDWLMDKGREQALRRIREFFPQGYANAVEV